MNLSTAFLPLHSRRQQEESRHLMSAPAQAVHPPIYPGTIMTKVKTKDRDLKVGDNNYLYDLHLLLLNDIIPLDKLRLYSPMIGTMSMSSLNTETELTVNAARASKPGSVSTELKLRSEKEKSITC